MNGQTGIDLEWLQRAAAWGLPLLADAAVKGFVLLLLTWGIAMAMRKASASSRQVVWVLAMASLLAMPMLSAALPSWQVLPDWLRMEATTSPPTMAATNAGKLTSLSTAEIGQDAAGPTRPMAPENQPPIRGPILNEDHAEPSPTQAAAAPSVTPPVAEAPAGRGSWTARLLAWVLPAWAAGAVACLVPLVLGRLSLWRLERTAVRITSGTWSTLLRRAVAELRLTRPVVLLESPRRAMPMVWGLWKVRLLLPAEATAWSADRRYVVLLHELAHARRHDCLAKLLAGLASAVYWFNPLVWLAAKRMLIETEAACDDLVLTAGQRASDYAQCLLEIASGLRVGMLAAYSSIAMARPSRLENRLLAILDDHRNRRRLTAAGVALAALLISGIVVPLSILQAAASGTKQAKEIAQAVETDKQQAGRPKTVRLIVGRDYVEFQGRRGTTEDLAWMLEDIPYRSNTTLEIAAASGTMLIEDFRKVEGRAMNLAKSLGYAGTSYVGVQPQNAVATSTNGTEKAPAKGRAGRRYFVRLVVGMDRMTFQGRDVTWHELPALIEKLPNRPMTVLELAGASGGLTVEHFDAALAQAGAMVNKFELEYLSLIGTHPLGSSGSAAEELVTVQSVGVTPAQLADKPITSPVDETKLSPQQAVAIAPNLFWSSTTWATYLDTAALSMEDIAGRLRIVATEPARMHIWHSMLTAPVDIQRYPVAVMTYRARNTWPDSSYVIWMDDTTGPNYAGLLPFRSKDLIADGAVHELRKDLRELQPKGPITALAVSIHSGPNVPAEFELLGLRFEHADDAVAVEPPKDDRPVSLRVLGSDGKAVEGATVTIDAERSNWARSASTDKDGLVTITPLANGSSTHMAWVSKPGFLATQEVIQSGATRTKIVLRPTVRCSGIVEDEQGKPVAGAGVFATWRIPSSPRREAHILTNAQGRWEMLIPADLPPKTLAIVVAHSDFLYARADDLGGSDTVPAMSQLLDGTAKFILKRGAEVSGSVFKPDGTPGEGALVRVRAGDNAFPPPPSACADSQGRFRLSRVIPGDLALSVELSGCASETKTVPASEIHQPVEFYLKLGKPERMRNWVEKTFDQDHPDITSRYSLEWGDVKVLGNGNLSIRYKYLAIFRDGSGMVIEQVFTFSPTGKFVSVKDLSKTPATQPALKDRSAEDSIEPLATQPAKAGRNAAARQVSDEDRRVREVMNQMMDGTINFKDVPLIDVLEHLRSTTGVNIWTNWKCLEAAGYAKESTIVSSVHLANVTYEKALRIILEDVSGPNASSARAIGYIIDGGVITISTMETLPSKADATDQNIQPPDTGRFFPATSPATQPETTQPSESKLYRDVYILGSVRRPGVYSMPRDRQPPITLRNLLAATGVQTETKGLSAQVLRATPEGVNQRFAVDVDGLFAGAVADPPLQENDLVLVQPADQWNPTVRKNPTSTDVMITGEVERPGVYSVDNAKVTLSRMLAGAGFDLTKVQQTRITVLRCKDGNEQTPISLELPAVLNGTVPDFEIVPGDVIAVTLVPLPTTRQGSPATQPAESAR